MENKNVIKDDHRGRIYFDTGIARNFETVLGMNLTFKQAQDKYPGIINTNEKKR